MTPEYRFYKKIEELFGLIGAECPPEGTLFDDCIPYVERAIEKLQRKADEYELSGLSCLPISLTDEQRERMKFLSKKLGIKTIQDDWEDFNK